MSNVIRKELLLPQPRERVWRAIADSAMLAQWMFPNDFKPIIGHQFTFQVPPNPKVNFEGLTVRSEVMECDPPSRLVFTWSAGGPVEGTLVTFRLEAEGEGTHLYFEHSGFDLLHPWADKAFKGADYGWASMLKQLQNLLKDSP